MEQGGLPETPNRLAVLAILFGVAFFIASTAAPLNPEDLIPVLGASTAVAVGASVLVLFLARRLRKRPRLLVDVAMVYQVFACLLIALSEHWLPWPDVAVRGISWTCLVLLTFPLAVTAPPDRTLIAGILGASATPIALMLMTLKGNPLPSARVFLGLALPPYLAAGIAFVLSRAVYRLGRDAERARRMGNYELVRALGRGGMGEVWLARHRLLKRPAAVKFVQPSVVATGLGEEPDTVFRRFEREAQTTAQLSSPHTVSLFDYGISEDGAFFYVMELLDGLDLSTMVERFGPLGSARAVHLLLQVCDSLAEAHSQGLIHRDVKPANVYVCRLGIQHDFVKVLDFGLVITGENAPEQLTRLTTDGLTSGTPAFMAPEMATGSSAVDERADVYAVGCLAYYLLTGRMVFESPSLVRVLADHVETQPVPPSQRTELPVPEDLEAVVLACLEKHPDRRPQTAEALAEQLRACELDAEWSAEQARRWWQTHQPRPEHEAEAP